MPAQQWIFLQKLLANHRLPQALLFSGPVGAGEQETARQFVKLVQGGKIKKDDFFLIEPEAGQIQIEKIRGLQHSLIFKPREAEIKAVIINQAHTLNINAQHCLLKTLEEPPGKTIFVLTSAFPEMLLSTVRSRCASLKFYQRKKQLVETKEAAILLKQSLPRKFDLAFKFAERPLPFLDNLIYYLRERLLQKLKKIESAPYSFKELTRFIEEAEQTRFLILTTNVNKRLALENLMLKLA